MNVIEPKNNIEQALQAARRHKERKRDNKRYEACSFIWCKWKKICQGFVQEGKPQTRAADDGISNH